MSEVPPIGKSPRLTPEEVERFWAKVERTDGCWLWAGAKSQRGYGSMYVRESGKRSRYVLAHRISYMLATGDWPSRRIIRHSCDTPQCVRPSHLSAGTTKDNAADAVARGQMLRGEKQPVSRLTEGAVLEMRRRYAAGESQRALSKVFGVAPATARLAILGETWSHVPQPAEAQP